jgi:hypothetical protein
MTSVKTGTAAVAAGQKVAENQNEKKAKKPFDVFWSKSTATIGQTVGIVGVANIVIKNPALVTVEILFNDGKYVSADSVTVKDGQVSASWKVKAKNVGTFTQGVYDAEIRYNGSVRAKPILLCESFPTYQPETFSVNKFFFELSSSLPLSVWAAFFY